MQLTRFKLQNFRVFKGEGTEFEFKPLNFITGPNNSGKSSLLKAIQLIEDNKKRPYGLIRLEFDGGNHRLGGFESVLNEPDKPLVFGWELPTSATTLSKPVFVELSYSKDNNSLSGGEYDGVLNTLSFEVEKSKILSINIDGNELRMSIPLSSQVDEVLRVDFPEIFNEGIYYDEFSDKGLLSKLGFDTFHLKKTLLEDDGLIDKINNINRGIEQKIESLESILEKQKYIESLTASTKGLDEEEEKLIEEKREKQEEKDSLSNEIAFYGDKRNRLIELEKKRTLVESELKKLNDWRKNDRIKKANEKQFEMYFPFIGELKGEIKQLNAYAADESFNFSTEKTTSVKRVKKMILGDEFGFNDEVIEDSTRIVKLDNADSLFEYINDLNSLMQEYIGYLIYKYFTRERVKAKEKESREISDEIDRLLDDEDDKVENLKLFKKDLVDEIKKLENKIKWVREQKSILKERKDNKEIESSNNIDMIERRIDELKSDLYDIEIEIEKVSVLILKYLIKYLEEQYISKTGDREDYLNITATQSSFLNLADDVESKNLIAKDSIKAVVDRLVPFEHISISDFCKNYIEGNHHQDDHDIDLLKYVIKDCNFSFRQVLNEQNLIGFIASQIEYKYLRLLSALEQPFKIYVLNTVRGSQKRVYSLNDVNDLLSMRLYEYKRAKRGVKSKIGETLKNFRMSYCDKRENENILKVKEIEGTSHLLCELYVNDSDKKGRYLADFGTGFAQLLPIVLTVELRKEDGGVLFIEEPEVNLHPDSQLKLAEYMVESAKDTETNLSIVIETHSLYFLRTMNAELTKSPEVSNSINLYSSAKSIKGDIKANQFELVSYSVRHSYLKYFLNYWAHVGNIYDVAISYAEKDKDMAESFYNCLSKKGYSVFFDRKRSATLRRGSFEHNLAEVFKKNSRFCLVLLSKHYLKEESEEESNEEDWWIDELAWIKTRKRKEGAKSEFIMSVSLDGVQSSDFHLDEVMPFSFNEYNGFDEIAEDICKAIGDPIHL